MRIGKFSKEYLTLTGQYSLALEALDQRSKFKGGLVSDRPRGFALDVPVSSGDTDTGSDIE